MRPEPWQLTCSGVLAEDGETRAHAVRGVVHRRESFPVRGPPFHVLLVTAAQELNPSELATVV